MKKAVRISINTLIALALIAIFWAVDFWTLCPVLQGLKTMFGIVLAAVLCFELYDINFYDKRED